VLDRDSLLGWVTHLCPLAYGSRGTLDKAWLERVEGAGEPGRHGPWAKNVSLGTLIPITGLILGPLFRSRIRPLLRVGDSDSDQDPNPTPWIPQLHMVQSTVPVLSAVHSVSHIWEAKARAGH
jgi:hypothetical protein